MNNISIILFLSFCPYLIIGQASIYCKNFTLNNKSFEKGEQFRRIYESVCQQLDSPPILVEREKIDELFNFIQEEKNLMQDLKQESVDLFKLLKVDYLILGNFTNSALTGEIEFYSECINVSSFIKSSFPVIRFSEKEFTSNLMFELKLKDMLAKYSFTDKLGVVPSDAFHEIKEALSAKDVKIAQLEEQVKAVIEYSDIARMNLYGSDIYTPNSGSAIVFHGPLIDEMANVFTFSKETNTHSVNHTEISLKSALKSIEIEPRFPFSYYAIVYIYHRQKNPEWVQYAKKALQILEYTNKIKGCHEMHKVCLTNMRALLKTNE